MLEKMLLSYLKSQAEDGKAFVGYYVEIRGLPTSGDALWDIIYETARWIVQRGFPQSKAEVAAFLGMT